MIKELKFINSAGLLKVKLIEEINILDLARGRNIPSMCQPRLEVYKDSYGEMYTMLHDGKQELPIDVYIIDYYDEKAYKGIIEETEERVIRLLGDKIY